MLHDLNYIKFRHFIRFSLSMLLIFLFYNVQATDKIEQLQQELQTIDSIKTPEKWASTLLKVGTAYLDFPDYEKASKTFHQVTDFCNRNDLERLAWKAEINIAQVMYFESDYDKSIKHISFVLENLAEDDLELRGLAYRYLAVNNIYIGNYSDAYKTQIKALKIYTSLKDTASIAKVEFGIGNNFFYQERYDKSLTHFEKSFALYKSINDEKGIMQSYGAFGSIYEQLDSLDKALEYNLLYYEATKKSGNIGSMGWALLNVGSIQEVLEKFNEAKKYLEEALAISKQTKDTSLESYVLETLANIHLKTKEYNKALFYLQPSYQFARNNNDRSNILDIYKSFSDIYFAKKDFNNYKVYIDKYIALKDSLLNEESMDKIAELQEEFKVEQIQQKNEINLLKKDKQIQRIVVISTIVIIILLSILAYNRYQSQREKHSLLLQKNSAITHQNEILEVSNKDLESYANIISHDLREPLRNISGFTTLLKRKLLSYNIDDKDTQEYMDFIVNNTNQMSNLLVDLLHYSKITMKKSVLEIVDSQNVVENIINKNYPEYDFKVVYASTLPQVIFDKGHLYEIFAQIIDNSIKFKDTNRPLAITFNHKDLGEEIEFSISDNGIGIEEAYFDKIFMIFKRLHNRSIEGSGVGLAICKKIIEMRGGRIWANTENSKTLTIRFTIPKAIPFALQQTLNEV